MKILIVLCALAVTIVAAVKIKCPKHTLKGFNGEVDAPGDLIPKLFNCSYIFSKSISRKNYLKIAIRNKELMPIKFEILEGRRKRSMEPKMVIEVPGMSTSEILLDKSRHLQIKPNGNAQHFLIVYEVIECLVHKSLLSRDCSKRYKRKSKCTFGCSKDYLPRSMKQTEMTAICRARRVFNAWNKNLSKLCMPREEALSMCIGDSETSKHNCPYTTPDLLKILNEETEDEEMDYEEMEKEIKQFYIASERSLFIRPPIPEDKKCRFHCAKRSNQRYFFRCGDLKVKILLQRCLDCRYTGSQCEGLMFIF